MKERRKTWRTEVAPFFVSLCGEKPEKGHAAILRGTLFLGSTAALTGSIFELAELRGHPRTSRLS